jgi:flagellar assembly protein FliH
MIRSRIIDKDHAQSADRWNFPSVDATAADALRGATTGGAHQLTAGQLDALQRQVREEAERRGYEEGLASGKAEIAARLARLTALVGAFTQPFQSLEQAVEDEPTLLQAAVHDCFAALAGSVRDVTVYLHPDDAALIRDQLAASAEQRFDIAVDAELARGDLRLGSSSSLVDGSIEVRCAEIIAAARNATSAAE